MRILHVLSQTELTGSEVYAAYLGRSQEAEGHEVFYISDRLHVPVPGAFRAWPISWRSWPRRLKNIRFLRQFIEENKIDVVHAHSRAASWVCHWATRRGAAAYVSTVHGRQHLHRSTKAYSVYGARILAISENVRRHLIEEAGFEPARIRMVPNGLCFKKWPVREQAPADPLFLIVGRTSGPKGRRATEVIEQFLPALLEKFPRLQFAAAGGPLSNYAPGTRALLEELRAKYPGRVSLHEYMPEAELAALIARATLAMASGRLALQALGRGIPVLAIGEAASHGVVEEANLEAAIASNFGDILARADIPVSFAGLGEELAEFFLRPRPPGARVTARIREAFDLERVAVGVREAYFQALLEKRVPARIPVLMYHKVVKAGYSSPHKTYIEEGAFARHLRTLGRLGFSGVTFADLEAAAVARRPLPRKPVVITFDDGYVGTHLRALPLLRRHGQRAVFYLLGDRARRANTWDAADEESALIGDDEIRELAAAGMEIGAHSLSHRAMDKLNGEECDAETRGSKRALEELTGARVVSYAYPYGSLSETAKRSVLQAGYSFGVATDSGGLSLAEDPLQVFRVNIFPHDGALQIFKKTLRAYRGYYARKRGK